MSRGPKRLTAKVEVPATPEQIRRWRRACERDGLALATWLRQLAEQATQPTQRHGRRTEAQ